MNTFYFIIAICDLGIFPLLLGLLLPFILGYLLRRFIDQDKTAGLTKLQSEYASLQGELSKSAGYKTNLHHAENETKKLQASVTKYESEIKQLNASLDTANKSLKPYAGVDLAALRAQISSLEANNISLQNSISEMSGAANSLEDVQTNANAMKERFAYLETENTRLKIDLKAAIAAKDGIERDNENIRKMKEEIREMSGKIGGYTVESDRLKAETSAAKATAKAAADELNDLKTKIAASQSEGDKAAVTANALQTKLNALQSELDAANAKATAAAAMEADFKAAQAKLADAEINLSNTKLKLENTLSENTKLSAAPPVEKIVEKIVEVPVEKIVENRVEVPVEKIVEKVVEVSSKADQDKITALEAEISALKAAAEKAPVTAPVTAPVAAPVTATPDDLEVVEGIGPKVNELFKAKGITTYKQLADMSEEEVAGVLETGGSRFRILNGNSWPKQAALLRDGKMEEFQTYTDYLIAGVDPKEVKTAADVQKDDLKIVEGIGPKIEALLNADGIYSFAQLADSKTDTLKEILENAGNRYKMHDPSTWAQQAALARDGKMDELKKLQDELNGGRA